MRIDEIMEALRKDLDGWVKERRGVLSVARDPWDALDVLINGPQGVQFVLAWGGDDSLGEQATEPLAGNIIELTVAYNLGLSAGRDAALTENKVDRPSLLKLTNDARARLLAYVFAANDEPQVLEYGGTQPVTLPEGIPLAAFRIRAVVPQAVEVETDYRGPGAALLNG